MTFIPYMRGATAHEAQIGRVCIRWPFFRFIRVGCWPSIYLDESEPPMHPIRLLMTEALRKMEDLRDKERLPYEDAIETLRKAIQQLPLEDDSS